MKANPILFQIARAAKKGEFFAFEYTKEETGEKSQRVIRFGGKIPEKLEREGQKINGRGAWMTGYGQGFRSCIVIRNGAGYVRGTDTKDSKHKIFKISGIKLKD